MTQDVDNVDQVQDTPENDEPQYSDIELKAMEQGWRPKDEWQGEEADFIDAKEFVRRKPLFDKIEHQHKELKQLKTAFASFKEHYGKVEQAAYERAYKELQTKQKEALKEGDVDTFYAIQEQLDDVKEQAAALKENRGSVQQEPEVHPEFKAWIDKNPWYAKHSHMKKFADDYGLELAAKGFSREEVLKKVESAVKEEFPNKFRNPNKDRPGAVESGSRGNAGRGGDGFELTEQERKIMNDLVRGGHITKEKYIADLKKAKGAK